MPSQKFFGLAKEGWSLVALCEEGLSLIGRHIFEHGAVRPCESGTACESPSARIYHETARQTRAFAEEVRDPETRRLLRALADRYDQMAVPVRRRPQFDIEK